MENREECSLPMFGRLRVHAVCWIVFLGLAVAMLLSCGARKAQVDIVRKEVKDEAKDAVESSKESASTDKSSVENIQVNDKTKEKSETTVTTKFNDAGKPIETTTTTKTSKAVDKTKYRNKTIREATLHEVEKLKTVTIRIKENIDYSKIKKTDANNNALYWTVGVLGFFVIGAVFLYFYIRRK